MASCSHTQNFKSLIINYNLKYILAAHPLKRTAKFHSSSHLSARLTSSPNNYSMVGSANRRLWPMICNASSENSSEISSPPEKSSSDRQLVHHVSLRMIMEIFTFIWRLPSIIIGFLKKEEKILDTVEEDINEAADVIKVVAKVVEEVAEGLEKVAKAVENDAERVDAIMDEVKEKTKVAHDELEDVVGSLEGSVQDVGKSVAKLKDQVKVSKEEASKAPTTIIPPPPPSTPEEATKTPSTIIPPPPPPEEATKTPSTIIPPPPPPPSTPTNAHVINANSLHYKPFQELNLVPGFNLKCLQVLLGALGSIQLLLLHINFEPLSNLSSIPRAFIGTLIMFSLIYLLGAMTTTPLIMYLI